ncbi:MAG: DUF1499 domain-containing protein [Planctomycetes bacterium]|nr:DUF1499 domain-containing protein [Planctomycetota bacterium]
MGSFETDAAQSSPLLRPLSVAKRREELYSEARDMVADLAGWTLVRSDDAALVLQCERKGGLFGGTARIMLRVEGPEGIPSATIHVRSETSGLFARDRANVREFLEPFTRRVGL